MSDYTHGNVLSIRTRTQPMELGYVMNCTACSVSPSLHSPSCRQGTPSSAAGPGSAGRRCAHRAGTWAYAAGRRTPRCRCCTPSLQRAAKLQYEETGPGVQEAANSEETCCSKDILGKPDFSSLEQSDSIRVSETWSSCRTSLRKTNKRSLVSPNHTVCESPSGNQEAEH